MLKDFRPFREPMFLLPVAAAALLLGSPGVVAAMGQ
jgi:hypothetical protein